MKSSEFVEIVASSFDIEEFRSFCLDLLVDYDDLPGRGKKAKVRELVKYMDRRGQFPMLIDELSIERPHIPWQKMNVELNPSPRTRKISQKGNVKASNNWLNKYYVQILGFFAIIIPFFIVIYQLYFSPDFSINQIFWIFIGIILFYSLAIIAYHNVDIEFTIIGLLFCLFMFLGMSDETPYLAGCMLLPVICLVWIAYYQLFKKKGRSRR